MAFGLMVTAVPLLGYWAIKKNSRRTPAPMGGIAGPECKSGLYKYGQLYLRRHASIADGRRSFRAKPVRVRQVSFVVFYCVPLYF